MAATAYIRNVNVTGHDWGSPIDAQGNSLELVHNCSHRIANSQRNSKDR